MLDSGAAHLPGSSAMLIEWLPASEGSSEWTTVLIRVCIVTAAVTALATAGPCRC